MRPPHSGAPSKSPRTTPRKDSTAHLTKPTQKRKHNDAQTQHTIRSEKSRHSRRITTTKQKQGAFPLKSDRLVTSLNKTINEADQQGGVKGILLALEHLRESLDPRAGGAWALKRILDGWVLRAKSAPTPSL